MVNQNPPDEPLEEQHLIEHLTDLRNRLFYSIVIVIIGFLGCWGFSQYIFDFVRVPIAPYLNQSTGGLVFTAPMDKFMAHVKVSFLAGIIVTCPAWIYQVWAFIAPGLYKKEKRYAIGFIGFGTFLFLLGVYFVYDWVYPMAFQFLLAFGGDTDVPMITIKEYLSFFFTTTMVFGLAFELPLILTMLGMAGVIDHHFLASKRRYAIVLLAAMSAMVTPPDVISMGMMMIPMLLLYESSVILVRIFGKRPQTD